MRSHSVAEFLGAYLFAVSCAACTPVSSAEPLALSGAAAGNTSAAAPDEHAPAPVDVVRQSILAHLRLQPGAVVAEIGMGHGWFAFRAAEAVGAHGTVYATDIDAEAIALVQGGLPNMNPAAGRVILRLCHGTRDTALDDLPDEHVDAILMVDSLCFDGRERHDHDVAYLRRFLRILRPGGRMVHHMDCRCDVAPAAVIALFTEAGFSRRIDYVDVPPVPERVDRDDPCRTDLAREVQRFVPVFQKPNRPDGQRRR